MEMMGVLSRFLKTNVSLSSGLRFLSFTDPAQGDLYGWENFYFCRAHGILGPLIMLPLIRSYPVPIPFEIMTDMIPDSFVLSPVCSLFHSSPAVMVQLFSSASRFVQGKLHFLFHNHPT